jgi:hypothetical protein
MSERNTVTRSLHDLGLAAWFGGSLMGAVGLNGAASEAREPSERLRLSSYGWAKWTPVQALAIGAHAIGSVGVLVGNRSRVKYQSGAAAASVVKTVLTVAAAGVTAYSGWLGYQVNHRAQEGARGATEPSPVASEELASAQRQLKAVQWVIPALTGALVVVGAVHGEQQRGTAGLLDTSLREIGSDPGALARQVTRSAQRALRRVK